MATKTTEVQEDVYKTPIPESRVYVDPGLMVTVNLPYNENRDEGEQFEVVWHNGKSYQIALGQPVEVPYPVFKILYDSGRYKTL